ncbi:MAG: hemolysin family protein [Desulfitobacteriaceae bacterium]|nr:hemolysin family protein [Desulfitobacteriaceae bacterium]MDD4752908.1 hemolysin family protein [Desulfitobacteriaceae bacterium]
MSVNWMGILLIFVLVLLNAFFAASEIAVISSRRVRIQQLKEENNKSAAILIRLMDDPSLFLATIQVGITLAGFLASATAAVGMSKILVQEFKSLGIPDAYANTLGIFVVTLIISYITLIFGELAPKRLAMQWSEKIALVVARPINFIAVATTPITRFLTFSTNIVVRLLGGSTKQQEKEVTEDEIRIYIAEHRTLPAEEKRMIEGVFNFGDQVVRQVMVPRTEIVYLHVSDTVAHSLDKVCNLEYGTFPVYKKDYDDIVGVVGIKDLVCSLVSDRGQTIESLMSPTFFVPETKSTIELLKELHRENFDMAIVVDEYGGTAGLVTRGDLVDEIIGDVVQKQNLIKKIKKGQWVVEGDTPIQDIKEMLNLKNVNLTREYETIAGFMLEQLGHLPAEGEMVRWEGYDFEVCEMGTRKINKINIKEQT